MLIIIIIIIITIIIIIIIMIIIIIIIIIITDVNCNTKCLILVVSCLTPVFSQMNAQMIIIINN